jgi:chromosomal replication initiator protein
MQENSTDDIPKIWSSCLNSLKNEIDPQIFTAYLEPLSLNSKNSKNSFLELNVPSNFLMQHVEKNFLLKIEDRLREISNNPDFQISLKLTNKKKSKTDLENQLVNGRYVIFNRKSSKDSPHSLENEENSNEQNLWPTNLNSKYLFDNFVVGNSNEFCHAAARSVAEKPGESYNPLFIYGGVGLGKTHLLHSIGNWALKINPNAKVLYISSEAFTNELIQSLRNAKMDEFKNKIRNIEILLLDDVQFISGKERTQEEFFHTFNVLYSAKRQIVMTSDKIPAEIVGIEERLQTRFSWGLTADLQAPDFETRVAILKRKAQLDSFFLPEDVAHLIADRISSNVRELEGALTRLHAVTSLKRLPITVKTAETSLAPLFQPKKISVSIEDIKGAVAQHFSLKVSEIISKRRTKNLSFPRHLAMYLCRKHTTSSYPEIGAQFGGRDHSSVIHAANVVTSKMEDEKEIRDLVKDIERRIFE